MRKASEAMQRRLGCLHVSCNRKKTKQTGTHCTHTAHTHREGQMQAVHGARSIFAWLGLPHPHKRHALQAGSPIPPSVLSTVTRLLPLARSLSRLPALLYAFPFS